MFDEIIDFIRGQFPGKEKIFLHEPVFTGNEKKYLNECIDSTFVSSVGKFVDGFENAVQEYTGASKAIATSNGTAALHIALLMAKVEPGDLVITQALTFIATSNAIYYTGAEPIFVDVDIDTMGLSPDSLRKYLSENAIVNAEGICVHKESHKRIRACVPMHTFGIPARIEEIAKVCNEFNIVLVEDAAESLGSFYKNKHTGRFGTLGVFSFNGNKLITTGGGGIIITDNIEIGQRAKHITTQAKIPHQWEYRHDQIGFNYRMPNVNAALGLAQIEKIDFFLTRKRELAASYHSFFKKKGLRFMHEIDDSKSNYWLNTILLSDRMERDMFLKACHEKGVVCRPAWTLMNKLPLFSNCLNDGLKNSLYLEDRLVNIPSSVIL